MKKKALISSILTIVLCLSLIAGSTFALFTSTTQNSISVTAGKVKVEALIDTASLSLSSRGKAQADTFANGGTATFNDEATVLTVSNITTGDKAEFDIVVTNTSNITIQYRIKWQVEGTLSEVLVATVDGEALVSGTSKWNEWAIPANGSDTKTLHVAVELPLAVKDAYQGQTASISFTVEAVQGNASDLFELYNCDVLATPETIDAILATVAEGTVIGLDAGYYDEIVLTQNNLTLFSNGTATVGILDLNEKDGITVDGLVFDAAGAKTAYNAKGADSGFVTNLTDGKAQNGGSVGVEIKNCAFIGTAADSEKYIPVYFGDASRGNRSDDITIQNCEFSTNAKQYITLNGVTNNSGKTPGKIVIENNVFGGIGFGTSHNTINATGQCCNWTIVGNTFYNWGIEKTAIGSSRNGSELLTWTVNNNKFYHEDGAVVMALKTSYTDANTVVNFENNTALDGMAEIVVTPVNAENETVFAGKKISTDKGFEFVSTTDELINAIKTAPVGEETVIFMLDGTYDGDITFTKTALGMQGGDIIIKAAAGATPVVTGTLTLGIYENRTTNVEKWNASVAFEGITFQQAEANKDSISVQNLNNLRITDCTFIGSGEYGVRGVSGAIVSNPKIEKCVFKNAGLQPLGNFGTNLLVDECTFEESILNVQAGNSVTVRDCTFNLTLTDAHDGESFYAIRSNAIPITITGCKFNIDSTMTKMGVAGSKGWGVFVNRQTANWTVTDVEVTMTDAAMEQTALKVATCLSTGKINMTNVTLNGEAVQ